MNTHWPLIVELAIARGVKLRAIQQWRTRRHVPWKWRLLLAEDARARSRRLPREAFEANGRAA